VKVTLVGAVGRRRLSVVECRCDSIQRRVDDRLFGLQIDGTRFSRIVVFEAIG